MSDFQQPTEHEAEHVPSKYNVDRVGHEGMAVLLAGFVVSW